MDVRVGLWRKLSAKKLMLLNYGVGEDSRWTVPWTAWKSNQSILKEISPWKDWCWSWNSNTLATSCEELTGCKRPWCWEGLGSGGEGDDRGWDGWMASPTWWTWVWVNSGSWWWTGRPGVLRFMGSQRAGHDWATELNWFVQILFSIPLVFKYKDVSFLWRKGRYFLPESFSMCIRRRMWEGGQSDLPASAIFSNSFSLKYSVYHGAFFLEVACHE